MALKKPPYQTYKVKDSKFLKHFNKSRKTKHRSVFCHAPFTSMNFQQNGDVIVCCFNKHYVIGHFPTQTLKEIWFGEKAMALRKKFNENILDAEGCDFCIKQLEGGDFERLHASRYDDFAYNNKYPQPIIEYPRVMEFEISNQCNLECTMCTGYYSSSIRKNREKLPPSKFYYETGFVDQLLEFIPHLEKATFLGGEPFMIKEYIDLWDNMRQINPSLKISITTNGTILNSRVKRILEDLQVWIIVSIDSIVEETYRKIRINADYQKVMNHIEYFIDYSKRKNTGLTFAVCPITDNWHEMAALTAYCNSRKIKLFLNTVIKPIHKSLKYQSPDKLEAILNQLKIDYWTKGLFMSFASKNTKQFKSLIHQVEQWSNNHHTYKEKKFQAILDEEKQTINAHKSTLTLPYYLNQDYCKKLLHIMTTLRIQHLPDNKELFIQHHYIKSSHQQLQALSEEMGQDLFVRTFFHMANLYTHIIEPSKGQNVDTIELILNRLTSALSRLNAWNHLVQDLKNAHPLYLASSVQSYLDMDESMFEQTLTSSRA